MKARRNAEKMQANGDDTSSVSSSTSSSSSLSASFRNLPKSELAGVIFGCTHETISECHERQLFGLPGPHIAYVRNIKPGLPLFLFNYSNRTLLGLYEAASQGQMNIYPHAWTKDGKQKTKYSAQVRIWTKMRCKPVREKSFKHIIKENYFAQMRFYFELNRTEVECLLSLFEPSPQTEIVGALPQEENTDRPPGTSLKTEKVDGTSAFGQFGAKNLYVIAKKASEEQTEVATDYKKPVEIGSSSILVSSEPTKLDLPNLEETMPNEDRIFEAGVPFGTTKELLDLEVGKSNSDNNQVGLLRKLELTVTELAERTKILETKQVELERELEQMKKKEKDSDGKYKQMSDYIIDLKKKLYSVGLCEEPSRESLENLSKSEFEGMVYLIGGYDGDSMLSTLHKYLPSSDVLTSLASMSSARLYTAATTLNHVFYIFGGYNTESFFDTVELYDTKEDKWFTCPPLSQRKGSLAGAALHGRIYAFGGINDCECFSDVEMFDTTIGKWINSKSMLQKRFAHAVTELNGALYAVGGFREQSYLKLYSAERFDPREGSWSWLPNMNHGRGAHSLVAFNEKLYAIGGDDGEKALSSTEVFDPRMGSWLLSEPMHAARGYASCLVLGDSLLTIGGAQDTKNILDTVECYREGIGWTVTGLAAIGKRAYFSAVVL